VRLALAAAVVLLSACGGGDPADEEADAVMAEAVQAEPVRAAYVAPDPFYAGCYAVHVNDAPVVGGVPIRDSFPNGGVQWCQKQLSQFAYRYGVFQ
jgi:hypothetical protein